MRGLLKIAQFAVADCSTFLLCALGLAFVLAQVVVLRKRYVYIGLLGLGCLAAGARRGFHTDGATDLVLMAAEVLAFANTVVFMVKSSWDNVRAVREAHETRRRVLIADLGRIATEGRARQEAGAAAPGPDTVGGPEEDT